MRTSIQPSRRVVCRLVAAAIAFALSGAALAADGTWTNTGGGDYSNSGNWQSGTVAGGTGATANFNTLDVSGEVVVTLDTDPIVGHLIFGDTDPTGTPGVWTVLSGAGNSITLDDAAPTITVNTLGVVQPDGFDDVFLNVDLQGTNGFTKLGPGILSLVGEPVAGNVSITGGINVDEGTLRFNSAAVFTTDSYNQTKTLANGTTLETGVNVNNVSVAAGATATLTSSAAEANNVTGQGTGETLNLNMVTAGQTLSLRGDWSGFNTINATGQDAGGVSSLRLVPNPDPSEPPFFNTNSFANTRLNLDNAQVLVRTNSYGNDIAIGELSGTATSALAGGAAGSAARYHIGALNTDSTFAGTIVGVLGSTDGVSIEKVGTGKLTLSGTFDGTGTTADADIGRRGGVVRVSAGTLALTGASAIPGGFNDVTYGDLYTTIDVLSGATLDVSGTPATFSTSALQQIQGGGTVVGNYDHDEGAMRPGDVSTVDNDTNMTNIPVPTAGTLTFDDNLSFGGSGGEIVFDLSPSVVSGNDLIQVNGVANLSGTPTLSLSFLGGFTTGTYTVLNSAGGFGGSTPAGWTVNWPGRGSPPTLGVSGNDLQLSVSAASTGNVNWTGATSGTWDINTTPNWYNNGTSSADNYFELDSVTFADTYGAGTPVANFTVTLNTAVTPTTVVVNSSNDYSITGSGKISGSTSLVKQGSGRLTLQLANDFSGGASIQDGIVDIGTFDGALGTGTLTMAGGKLIASNTASGVFLDNSGLATATGTSSTIEVGGTQGRPLGLPALSGDGGLTLSVSVANKLIDLGNNSGFTGNLTIGAGGDAGGATVRLNGTISGLSNSIVTLTNGGGLRDRNTGTALTIPLGALAGDSGTTLGGYVGGAGNPPTKNWEIGALNTSTTFAGTIINGPTTSVTSITKVGTATLTLTGANTYTGTTTVSEGTLLINGDSTAATGAVIVEDGGILGGTGTVGGAVTVQAGGRILPGESIDTLTVNSNVSFASGAIFDVEVDASSSDLLAIMGNLDLTSGAELAASVLSGGLPSGPHVIATYTGTLTGVFDAPSGIDISYGTGANSQITITVNSIVAALIGDYNDDGIVDARDYTRWRDNLGGDGSVLLNRDPANTGNVSEDDYASWKLHFGETGGSGSLAAATSSAVPEPSTAVLACAALLGCILLGGRRRR